MFKLFIVCFIAAYALAAFYITVRPDVKSPRRILAGSVAHLLANLVFGLLTGGMGLLWFILGISTCQILLLYSMLLCAKWPTVMRLMQTNQPYAFISFHLINLLVILGADMLFMGSGIVVMPPNWVSVVFNTLPVNGSAILFWGCALLLAMKPVNTLFKVCFQGYKPDETPDDKGNPNAGALIGDLERIIVIILLSANQYAAIGLIFTAKSIARYEKIVKDSKFGEYYLQGTLTSILCAIIIYLFILK